MQIKYKISVVLMTIFSLFIVSLAIRPYIPSFYNKMYGIDVGGWVMYKYDLVSEYNLTLISDDKIIDLNASQYIWHGSFGSSAHPHYNKDAMRKFLDILSEKLVIKKIIDEDNVQKIIFKMKLTKNKEYWKTIVVEKEIK